MQAEFKTAQLRVKPNCIIAEGGGGQIFYASPTRARALIDAGAAELVNVSKVSKVIEMDKPIIGPTEAPIAGPTEFKEPAEKKSYSPAVPDGRLTDSPSSIESGKAAPSSSSAAAQVSPKSNAKPSPKRGRPVKSKR